MECVLQGQTSERTDCPRVSVITPFLNNDVFLAETIDSVIAQTFSDWEYLLVDDGSGPAATAIAKEYATRHPGKIRYFEHSGHFNRGISATRNLGVQHARGEFIAFLDSDDVWLPSKLADHVAILDAHEEVGMVCGATVVWRSWSNGVDQVFKTGHRMQNMVVYPPEAAVQVYPLGRDRTASFSDVVFRAELVRRLGGFEDQFTGLYDDQVLLLKVYLSTPVFFCSTISNKYRQHPTSTSATASKRGKDRPRHIVFPGMARTISKDYGKSSAAGYVSFVSGAETLPKPSYSLFAFYVDESPQHIQAFDRPSGSRACKSDPRDEAKKIET